MTYTTLRYPLSEENMNLSPILRAIVLSSLLLTILFAFPAAAQQQPAPSIPSAGAPGLDEYRTSRIAIYTSDFGELARYQKENAALPLPSPNENRVIFLGDSITDYWKLPNYFPG